MSWLQKRRDRKRIDGIHKFVSGLYRMTKNENLNLTREDIIVQRVGVYELQEIKFVLRAVSQDDIWAGRAHFSNYDEAKNKKIHEQEAKASEKSDDKQRERDHKAREYLQSVFNTCVLHPNVSASDLSDNASLGWAVYSAAMELTFGSKKKAV